MLQHRNARIFLLATLLFPALASAAASTKPAPTTALQQAVDSNARSAANKARDRYRHPAETLQFFGIRPDMTVVELAPGGGWYTEILAPYLHDHGHLVEATSPSSTKFAGKLKADPALYGKVTTVPFDPPAQTRLGANNSADMVLTFRNAHDWLNDSPAELSAVFKATFDVLKPGGVFGLTEHRAKPFADALQSSGALHRLPEDYLIDLALKTGFRLDGASEINANPNDPEDLNVHHLPPNLAGPASERAKMQAIGESDRMTLRFVKP